MKTLYNYISKEIQEGKTEFRLVINSDKSFYVHPMNKDGETLTGSLTDWILKIIDTPNIDEAKEKNIIAKYKEWYENWRDDSYPSGYDVEQYIRQIIVRPLLREHHELKASQPLPLAKQRGEAVAFAEWKEKNRYKWFQFDGGGWFKVRDDGFVDRSKNGKSLGLTTEQLYDLFIQSTSAEEESK